MRAILDALKAGRTTVSLSPSGPFVTIEADVNGDGRFEAICGDEVIVAEADFTRCELGRTTIFDFARHRRPEHYARIVEQVGSEAPPVWRPGQSS